MSVSAAGQPIRETSRRRWPTREQALAFIRLSRLKFLLESLLTVTLGLTIAVFAGHRLRLGDWLLVQAFVSGTHLMTHYCNEYFDYEADTAQESPTGWTGGSRVLARGQLRPEVSLAAAFVMLFAMIAVVAAIPDSTARGLCAAMLGLGWFYTAPPLRLNYRGLGEVTTAGMLTVLTPVLACYLQAGTIPGLLPAVVVPLFLVMAARMMVMNLIDRDADLTVGKHTVATALGVRGTALAFAAAQVAAYTAVAAMTGLGTIPLPAGVALIATAPLAWLAARRLLNDPLRDTAHGEAAAFMATVHAAATGYAAAAGLVVAAAWSRRHDPALSGSVIGCVALIGVYTLLQVVQQVSERRRPYRRAPQARRPISGTGTDARIP
jgi:1,4-dihydroxy-2-naphthoate polyprenyltransferase